MDICTLWPFGRLRRARSFQHNGGSRRNLRQGLVLPGAGPKRSADRLGQGGQYQRFCGAHSAWQRYLSFTSKTGQ